MNACIVYGVGGVGQLKNPKVCVVFQAKPKLRRRARHQRDGMNLTCEKLQSIQHRSFVGTIMHHWKSSACKSFY